MKTLAVVQHKGGVGKTTIAVNLAAGLAAARKRTVLIDLDPQRSASAYLAVEASENAPHLADLLRNEARWWHACVPAKGAPHLAVIPGDLTLSGLNLKDPYCLRSALNLRTRVRGRGADAVVIDTPPGWGMLTVNALVAATDVIAPAELKPLSLVALVDLVAMIADVRDLNKKLPKMPWVVPSRAQRTRLSSECLEELASKFPDTLLPSIRESARVAEAPGFHKPLSQFAPDSIGAEDFAALTRAVLRKVF